MPDFSAGVTRICSWDRLLSRAKCYFAIGWKSWGLLHLSMQALQHDEQFASAHVSLALIKMRYEWDWVGAERVAT